MKFLAQSKKALVLLLAPVLLVSCASYNARMTTYYHQIETGQYKRALQTLEHTRLIKKDRNELLYYLEKGRVYHLMQLYDSSNRFFNLADAFIEQNRVSFSDLAVSNLLNPMMTTYMGEDMERFMMHYYKALNYIYLNQAGEAVVEARRITLANNQQSDKFSGKNNRYSADAFSLNIQGMIYEANGDINNAFIAYRNAANVYLKANKNWYGVSLPRQLAQDVLRTAYMMGFEDEFQRFQQLFNMSYQPVDNTGGSLVLFVEKGVAPIKKEQNFVITNNGSGFTGFYYTNQFGNRVNVPFDVTNYSALQGYNSGIENIRTFRVAIPYYEVQYFNNANATVVLNKDNTFNTETAQNLNVLSTSILSERMLKEIANALARQIVKKLAEKGVGKATEAAATSDNKEKDNEKKAENAKVIGDAAGLLINVLNTATEKADTRNWQSLPAFIDYVRIPLQLGENTVKVTFNNRTTTLNVKGTGGLQFKNLQVR